MNLGVNIDHIATVRQARYSTMLDAHNCEPDIIAAAGICEHAGAKGITAHLRSDRRHMQDSDIRKLREKLVTKLNFEMGNTPEILAIALDIQPDDVCLVPENRHEITTEGGLDVVTQFQALEPTVHRLQAAGIRVSLFIEPSLEQIDATKKIGAEMIELHTGAFANAEGVAQDAELGRLHLAATYADAAGLQVNAGHGLNYVNLEKILTVPHLTELNIGHSIIARSLFIGLQNAVCDMIQLMSRYRGGV